MPTRFEAYRMRDGVTPLAEDYFNPVLADIDARIGELEERRADLSAVIADLTAFGLSRIDSLLGPSMSAVSAMMDDLEQRRDDLLAAIGNAGELVTQSQLAAAVAAEAAARHAALLSEQAARAAAIAQATTPPTAATYTYDTNGRVTQIAETLAGGTRTTTFTYDSEGRVATAVEVYGSATRTTTYTYTGGVLTGFTVS